MPRVTSKWLFSLCRLILILYRYGNALTASAYDGTLDILKVLLDHGAKADSAEGWALQTAATEGHVDIVKELLSRGAKVDAKTENPNFQQQTALQGACEFGRDEIVDILLEHGANPNLGGGEDDYPIIAAAKYCQIDIIGKLISANADVNVVGGEDGDTALIMTAKRIANIEPLEQLLKAGAKIDATNNNGDTALIAAAAEGDNEFVNFLLAKGADVMHTNNDDMNALQAASDNHVSKETWNVLIKHISTILSGLKKRMEDGDHGVISAVGEARAVARADNVRDCSSEEGSDRGSIMTDVTKNDHRKSFGYEQDDFKTTEKSMTHAKVADPRLSIDQSSLQYVAGPMDELRHEIDAATMFHQDDAFKRSDIHPGNMFAHQYFDDTNLPLRTNADPFTTHDPTQRAEAWQQQVDVPYDNHHLPRWSNDGQNVNISQNLDGLPQRNSMGPLRRKPAPVLHGTRNYSQGSLYSERPSSQEGVTPHQQPSSYIPYNPSNFAPTVHSSSQSPPRLPPLSSPPSYSSQPDTQSHYQSGYHGAMGASMQANQVPPGSDRYAAKPPLIQAYSSPAQIPPPLPQRVGPNTNYTTPPLRQDARPNYFGVKDTFNQAKDRLFSPYRGDDSER
jgi:ankyrin repeat protein